MKPFVRLSAVVIGTALLYAGAAFADETHYRVDVQGMNCPFCAYGIEKKLEKLDGVEKVDVELAAGQFWLEVDDGVTLSEDTVSNIIRDASFTFKGMTHHEEPASLRDESE